jgi:hypothetical protein
MSRVLALLVAVLAGLGAGAASVTSSGPAAAADPVHLALTAQPFAVAPNGRWSATFAVTGDLGTATPATTVVPNADSSTTGPAVTARVIARRPVTDGEALGAAFEVPPSTVASVAAVAVALTSDGDQTSFTVTVPTVADPEAADPEDPGVLVLARTAVYPVTVELLVDGTSVARSDTFLYRLPVRPNPARSTMKVAVVGDVTDPGPTPTPAQLATGRDELQAIAESADALGGTLTLRIPPSVVASLADDDPGLLTTLRTAFAPSEVLSTPSPTLDPSSAVAAGLDDNFASDLREGEDILRAVVPSSPPQRSAWVTEGPISTPAAAMLRDPLRFDALVFDQAVYNTLAGSIGGFHDWSQSFTVELGDDTSLPGFVVAPGSRWLDRAELDRRTLSPTDGAVRLMAELVTRQGLDPTVRRGVVLSLPPGVAPDPEVATALASYVAEVPGFALTELAALPESTGVMEVPDNGPESVRLPATAGPDMTDRVNRVNLTRYATTSAASMLDGHAQLDEWDAELDAVLSTAIPDDDANAEIDRIDAEVKALYGQVEAPQPFTFTLTGRRSDLRLNIRNNGTEVLHVVVRPSSPKLRFPRGDAPVDLLPGGMTEVRIPVQAQTNGTSAIGIDIVTPVGGQRIQGPVILTARVNALSGLGQVVTGAALLVLVSWWYGHFRRRRRLRRAMIGEIDNPTPIRVGSVSPDAAEAAAPADVASNGDHEARSVPAAPLAPVAPEEPAAAPPRGAADEAPDLERLPQPAPPDSIAT